MDGFWTWAADHAPQLAASAFAVVILIGCVIVLVASEISEWRMRAEQVRRLRAIDARAAALRRAVGR